MSSIILSHPSLKNDQNSLCKLVDDELESSSHISFILWVFALMQNKCVSGNGSENFR